MTITTIISIIKRKTEVVNEDGDWLRIERLLLTDSQQIPAFPLTGVSDV